MPYADPVKRREYAKERQRRIRSGEHVVRPLDPGRETSAQTKARLIREFRAQGCARCGEEDPRVIDAHHVPDRGPKAFSISSRHTRSRGLAAVIAELAKCEPLCANCHRREHADQRERTRRGLPAL